MTRVKICGISREIDAEYLNNHLPDYSGFIFAQSKRRVTPERAKELSGKLDGSIRKVGVFVNEDIDKILELVEFCALDAIQLHGDENNTCVRELKKHLAGKKSKKPVEVWKAFRVKDEESLREIGKFDADAFVLDTYVEGIYGGVGTSFDWSLAAQAGKNARIILAGGLDSRNVSRAIGIVRPFAVDVSSGVETDGVKDEGKIKDFIYSSRSMDY